MPIPVNMDNGFLYPNYFLYIRFHWILRLYVYLIYNGLQWEILLREWNNKEELQFQYDFNMKLPKISDKDQKMA